MCYGEQEREDDALPGVDCNVVGAFNHVLHLIMCSGYAP